MTGRPEDDGAQAEVAAFLAALGTHGGGAVKRIDTHAAMVFLAGPDVYKIKRAVRFAFLDFSTLEKRRIACEREVALNRLTAPDLYLGTVPVTRRPDGGLALGGDGPAVEWAVHMRRFDESATFDRLCAGRRLTAELADALARRVAALHEVAPAAAVDDPAGRVARIARENCAEMRERPDLFPPAGLAALVAGTEAALRRLAPLIEARAKAGEVRRCHGDLHLANIALIDGRPVIFDALEFDEDLATIDVAYDVAFLLMDLWARGERRLANRVLNRWLVERGLRPDDLDGLALLPLFLSMRAAIRAKVAAARAAHLDGEDRAAAEAEARTLFAVACAALADVPARLVAIGGLSGTGKTTLAMALACDVGRAPGAVVVRSDVLRKLVAGVAESERLPPQVYTPEASRRVYDAMHARAARALAAGHAAILDAVHARPDERAAARAVAEAAGVGFHGLWLEAPEGDMVARVTARRGDASDADAAVVARQLGYETGEIDWPRVDTGGGLADAVRQAASILDIASPSPEQD